LKADGGKNIWMVKQIGRLLARTPFEPFSIVTTSGHEYPVDHPENAAIVAGRVVVALPNDEGVVTLGGLHIAEIKDFSKSNGI
jgi:hypothetical protein